MDLYKLKTQVAQKIDNLIEQIGELFVSTFQEDRENDYQEEFGCWIEDYITK